MMQENESGQIFGDVVAVYGGLEKTAEGLLVKTGSVLLTDQNGHLTNGGRNCHRLLYSLGS